MENPFEEINRRFDKIEKMLALILYNQEKQQLPEKDKFLSRKETAKTLHISLPTLSELNKNGVIVAHRIGKRILYKQSEINKALKQIKR